MPNKKRAERLPALQTVTTMTIGTALLLLLGLLLAVLITNMLFLLERNERENMRERGNIATGVISSSTENLQALTRDWSSWDESYDFVLGENDTYPDEVMNDYPFLLHSLNLCIIKDLDGNDLFVRFFDFYTEEDIEIPDGFPDALAGVAKAVLTRFDNEHEYSFREKLGVDGFFFYKDVCYYICGLPVLTSDESSEPVGTYFFGRIVDETEILRITGAESPGFHLFNAEEHAVVGNFGETGEAFLVDNGNIYYSRQISDIFGEPTVILQIEDPRTLYSDGIDIIALTSVLAAGIMLLFMFILLIAVSRVLVGPLRSLSVAMSSITPETQSLDIGSASTKEIATLELSANEMLSTLKQSRRRLVESSVSIQVMSSVLNGLDAYLHVSDPATDELLFANDKLKDLLGISGDVTGRNCWQTLHPGSTHRCDTCPAYDLLSSDGDTVTWEEFNPATDRYYKNINSIIEWTGGKKAHLQYTTDITDLKLAQMNLVEAKDQAEEGSRAKSEFLSRMSHEIRTPMNAIIGMTEIAQKSDDPERKEYCLEKIEGASRQLLGVINDILDMSKIEANKFELSFVDFSLEKMLGELVGVLSFRAGENGQTIVLNIDKNIPAVLHGDDQRLGQVITNLLSNAIKFSPDGGKIVTSVELIERKDEHCKLRFSVTDRGIGIDSEQIKRLFTSFEQADGGISRKYGGSGLGLAISKRIIDMMGGDVGVDSEVGKGSCFHFTIVLNAVENSEITAEITDTPDETSAKTSDVSFDGVTILVAEDVDINREILAALLDGTGITLDFAVNGREAVDTFFKTPDRYDLILMDVQMPEMDGLDATRGIRAHPSLRSKNIPIIAMTANVFREDIEKCLDAGMNDHVGKPLDLDLLFDKMKFYLKK